MENWIIHTIEQYGYIGILFLIALENVFPPIPSEVILTFGGFMTTKTNLTIGGVVVASTLGSVLGAAILYGVGSLMDIERLGKIVDKWGHILRLTKKDVDHANARFLKYGVWAVFLCRFIPLIRSLISIPAGMARMKFSLFLLLTTIGTAIWNIVLIKIGAMVGESWENIVEYMNMYSHAVYALLIVLFIAFIVWLMKKKRA